MKIVIVSGYFNPLHGGHLDMIESARRMGDRLIVIVNNDAQQILKKGKIILDQDNRMRLMRALRDVDEVMLGIDDYQLESGELPSILSLEKIAQDHPDDELVFANGGDRDLEAAVPEAEVCRRYHIEMRYDAGSGKHDSSTRINQALGHKK